MADRPSWWNGAVVKRVAIEGWSMVSNAIEKGEPTIAAVRAAGDVATELVRGGQERKTALVKDELAEKQSARERRNAGYLHDLAEEAADNQLVRDRASMRGLFQLNAATSAVNLAGDIVYRVVDGVVADRVARAEHERTLVRLHTAAELAESAAERDHVRELDLAQERAVLSLRVQQRVKEDDRESADGPFGVPDSVMREQLAQHTDDGRLPALMIAPFHRDGDLPGVEGFRPSVREMWDASAWGQDAVLAEGFTRRALHRMDYDLLRIGQVVGDLPVILVWGVVRADHQVVPKLTAWNLGSRPDGRATSLTFTPMVLPRSDERVEFENALGELLTGVLCAMTDRFHLVRHGRPPSIETLRSAPPEIRQALALSAVLAYDTAIRHGVLPDEEAVAGQAHLLSASGLTDQATETVTDALDTLTDSTRPARELITAARETAAVADELGDPDLSARAGRLLDDLCRRAVGELYGGSR
ncbi:hypothetical protein [Actinophytocola sp.]|uniref:hypothetical protein n=1 Tax=Actinophytocola sp. TaxID=1872138 RepID=UPI002ECFC60F